MDEHKEYTDYLEGSHSYRASLLATFFLIGVFATMISLTTLNNEQEYLEIELQDTQSKCTKTEYWSDWYGGCVPEPLKIRMYNSLGFDKIDVKQIIGRVVQIESGDHITLESGDRYPISNGIEDIWIDDLVTLHKIEYKSLECSIGLLNFLNGTTIRSDVFPFKGAEQVLSIEEISDLYHKMRSVYDKRYGYNFYEQVAVRNISEQGCEKSSVWEIEKIG